MHLHVSPVVRMLTYADVCCRCMYLHDSPVVRMLTYADALSKALRPLKVRMYVHDSPVVRPNLNSPLSLNTDVC